MGCGDHGSISTATGDCGPGGDPGDGCRRQRGRPPAGAPSTAPRALGVGEVKFTGQVPPSVKQVRYVIDLKRVINRRLVLGIADGHVEADGQTIYTAKDLRVGLFRPEEINNGGGQA